MMSIYFGRNWNENGNVRLILSLALHVLYILQYFSFHVLYPVWLVGRCTGNDIFRSFHALVELKILFWFFWKKKKIIIIIVIIIIIMRKMFFIKLKFLLA